MYTYKSKEQYQSIATVPEDNKDDVPVIIAVEINKWYNKIDAKLIWDWLSITTIKRSDLVRIEIKN